MSPPNKVETTYSPWRCGVGGKRQSLRTTLPAFARWVCLAGFHDVASRSKVGGKMTTQHTVDDIGLRGAAAAATAIHRQFPYSCILPSISVAALTLTLYKPPSHFTAVFTIIPVNCDVVGCRMFVSARSFQILGRQRSAGNATRITDRETRAEQKVNFMPDEFLFFVSQTTP